MSARRPYIEIVEQPAGKAIKFRYESERRKYPSIPGVNSTPSHRTHPTIRIVGLDNSVVSTTAVVSCVTKDPPHKVHPHHVVSEDVRRNVTSKYGVVSIRTAAQDTVEFKNISIQCVKQRDMKKSLLEREIARVDPFGQGYQRDEKFPAVDCLVVRLCFEVTLERQNGLYESLEPVVSDVIYDNKSFTDLLITRLNTAAGSAAGGSELIIYAEKVIKQDIKVRFFEEAEGQLVWEAFGNFQPTNVLKQSIIILKVPPYRNQNITEPVAVKVQLMRSLDGESGSAVTFQYVPPSSMGDGSLHGDIDLSLKRKRKKFSFDLLSHPHVAKCGCILKPIIQPDCAIHNPSALDLTTMKGNKTRRSQKQAAKENNPSPPNVTVKPVPSNIPNITVRPGLYNIPSVMVRPGPSNVEQNVNVNAAGMMSTNERFSREIDEYWSLVYGKSATTASMWPSALHPPIQNAPARVNNQKSTVRCRERQEPSCAPCCPPPASPLIMQHNFQRPAVANNAGAALSEVPKVYDNPMNWSIPPNLPPPISQPLVAIFNEELAMNYDCSRKDEPTTNRNQLDFDEYMRTLSDSVGSMTIHEGELSPEESEKSEENNNSSTTDNLIRVCDNTIQQILEISKQQNYVMNTRR